MWSQKHTQNARVNVAHAWPERLQARLCKLCAPASRIDRQHLQQRPGTNSAKLFGHNNWLCKLFQRIYDFCAKVDGVLFIFDGYVTFVKGFMGE